MTQRTLPGTTANEITARLLIEIPKQILGARCWRQNVGRAVGLDTVRGAISLIGRGSITPAVALLQHRPIQFGLVGSADIDGIVPPHGTRLAIEVKAGRDRLSDDQRNFGAMIQAAGGIWIVARSVEQALEDLKVEIERRK